MSMAQLIKTSPIHTNTERNLVVSNSIAAGQRGIDMKSPHQKNLHIIVGFSPHTKEVPDAIVPANRFKKAVAAPSQAQQQAK